jgi:iron-sulfur cluster assembly protein
MISMTDKGAEKAREYLDAQGADVSVAGLRVGVRGGGCSGFQYQLAFDEQRADDRVFESHGLKLLVEPAAIQPTVITQNSKIVQTPQKNSK